MFKIAQDGDRWDHFCTEGVGHGKQSFSRVYAGLPNGPLNIWLYLI